MLCKGPPGAYENPAGVGAIGSITLTEEIYEKVSLVFGTPTTNLIPRDFAKVESYVNSTRSNFLLINQLLNNFDFIDSRI